VTVACLLSVARMTANGWLKPAADAPAAHSADPVPVMVALHLVPIYLLSEQCDDS